MMRIRNLPFNLMDRALSSRSNQTRKQSILLHIYYLVAGTFVVLTLDLRVHGRSEHMQGHRVNGKQTYNSTSRSVL